MPIFFTRNKMRKRVELWALVTLGLGLIVASWQAWLPYSLTETLGFVTGVACVYLVVKRNILNFPIGIANNVFFIILFLKARLYGDAGLQVVYIALGLHGWYWWLRGGHQRTALVVAHAAPKTLGLLSGGILLGTAGLTLTLQAVNGSAPVLDALTTVLSLAAQLLLNYKLIENWYVWLVADVIYIYLYVSRGLHLTAILYFVFLFLCVAGLISWWRALARQSADGKAAPTDTIPARPGEGAVSNG